MNTPRVHNREAASAKDVRRILAAGEIFVSAAFGLHDLVENEESLPKASGHTETASVYFTPAVDGGWRTPCPTVIEIRSAATVELAFVSVQAMLDALAKRFEWAEISPAFEPEAICVKERGAVYAHPALTWHSLRNDEVICRFTARLDRLVACSQMARPVFDFCREFVLRDENQVRYSLQPGERALVPNALVLNGLLPGEFGADADYLWDCGNFAVDRYPILNISRQR